VCHKHETLLGCPWTTSPQKKLIHLKYRLFWTHMEDIWHLCHCDPKLWTHYPCPLHSQFWHIMSIVCPCTTNALIIEKYSHHICFLFGLGNIWHVPLPSPKSGWCGHPFVSMFNYLSFNLIAWHISFCEKN
jgi:hypothetical protein